MNHPRNDFLAGAGRPEDQHRDVGLRRGPDPLEDDQHLLVPADHLAESLNGRGEVLVTDGGSPLEELVEQVANCLLLRLDEHVFRRAAAGRALRDAERHQLADAVVHVEPHAPERLHQRLDVEPLRRPRAEKPKQGGPKWRLHERLEARFDLGRLSAPSMGGYVVHVIVPNWLAA